MGTRTMASIGQTAVCILFMGFAGTASGGSRGSEFDLTLTPAAGGMEGVGTARPQDPIAMLFANPATLTQLAGSNAFTIGVSYASPSIDASGLPTDLIGGPPGPAPLTGTFDGGSRIRELVAPHAAALQRFSPELVAGVGFTAVSGLGSDFRDVPGMPNLLADLKLFGANLVLGYEIAPGVSVGGAVVVGIGNLQVGLTESGAAVNNLGVGGHVGVTYDTGLLLLGVAYKAPLSIEYEHVIETAPNVFVDFTLEQAQEVQVGLSTTDRWWANSMVEVDFRYKNWDSADGYSSIWKDQYVVSIGGQHKLNTGYGGVFLRTGYSWGTQLTKGLSELGTSFGEITQIKNPGPGPASLPVTPTLLQLVQATATAGIWRQGVSFGVGWEIPNTQLRIDMNTSYAFDGEQRFGRFETESTIFTAGMGITWNF